MSVYLHISNLPPFCLQKRSTPLLKPQPFRKILTKPTRFRSTRLVGPQELSNQNFAMAKDAAALALREEPERRSDGEGMDGWMDGWMASWLTDAWNLKNKFVVFQIGIQTGIFLLSSMY